MPHDDDEREHEEERREAIALHSRMVSDLRSLTRYVGGELDGILGDQANRTPDSSLYVSRQQAWVKGKLLNIQRRIDQMIRDL